MAIAKVQLKLLYRCSLPVPTVCATVPKNLLEDLEVCSLAT